jgi:hypothetical protein
LPPPCAILRVVARLIDEHRAPWRAGRGGAGPSAFAAVRNSAITA